MKHPLLERNISQVIIEKELNKELQSGKQLRIYLGVDPTGPTIHLGHAIILRKLRDFQKAGHSVTLLIGDFTAQIGDPTGKDTTRKPLTHEEVLKNAQTYKEQASLFLDFNHPTNPATIQFNSEWLSKLTFQNILELSSQFTVQQMIERDMFQERIKNDKPIGLHEFLYPLMQGYDSVVLKADIEIGGTDQTFNMLAGRTLRQKLEGQTKNVITVPLLVGTDGRKMSKSFHNDIGVSEPPFEQFGKIMSMKDDLIIEYFTLCTEKSLSEIKKIEVEMHNGKNPRDIKLELAFEIVSMYHSPQQAQEAQEEFINVYSRKNNPSNIQEIHITKTSLQALELIKILLPHESASQIRRLFNEGAIKQNKVKIIDFSQKLTVSTGDVFQIGKRHFFKINILP